MKKAVEGSLFCVIISGIVQGEKLVQIIDTVGIFAVQEEIGEKHELYIYFKMQRQHALYWLDE